MGEDEDESATDEAKIEYQMHRRFLSKEIFWATGSLDSDFKFFCANKHPIFQFFAHDKVDPLGKFISGVIELNAILIGFRNQKLVATRVPGSVVLPWYLVLPINLVTAVITMLAARVQFEMLACPCQSSS